MIYSALIINDLYDKHNGYWSCSLLSSKFNRSLSIKVNVITKETLYCETFGMYFILEDIVFSFA